MRFKRVLLISPPSQSRYGGLRVPAGIGQIAQVLYDNNIDYQFVDMRLGHSIKYLKRRALKFEPDLMGISMITQGYKNTYQIISNLKTLLPDTKIVVGGHHVTILKGRVLEECESIDFGVVADGEETILELCEGKLPLSAIQGLIYRQSDRIYITGERKLSNTLDTIAYPKYHKFGLSHYSKQIPLHSSRGCIYKCTFCPNKVLGSVVRKKSVHYFVDELEYWYDKGYRQFAIDDDNFTLDKNRVYAICDEIEKRQLNDLFVRCSNGIRADRVDRRLLGRMKEIGVNEIGIGVDGGNNRILKFLKKGETIEQIEEAIKDACDLGIDVKIFIIVGTPHETVADIEDSIRLAKQYPVARVNFNNAIPYPGTEMYDYVRDHSLFLIEPEQYLNSVTEEKLVPVFATPELPKEARIDILKRCHKIEKEVMKNTAVRIYSPLPIFNSIIRHLFVVSLFERLFFKNLLMRKIFESLRYKKMKKV